MHTLRPARDDDYAFVYELQERTMRAYVEAAFDAWDDDWQRAFFAQHWSPEHTRIVEVCGEPAGRLEVHERDDHVYLANINLLPAHQGRGIGAAMIRGLIDDAAPRPVTLRVLKSNPDARRLYERLGFELTHEIDTHHYFRFNPATADEALCAASGPQTVAQP
ncbi:MAG: GNAT family N-acetyltransferase [Phycisphaera sp.]|nr:GNAT family N-acetyltransferase [Phycisphaera sp.]